MADDITDTQPSNELPSLPERRIGPYRVLRELGHGGMGTVFLAARDDDEYRKRVAVKLIKGGPASADAVRHFKRERQILASIEHPNIAQLLDGGTTDEGLPYFVMEYIEGRNLLEHADLHCLPIRERLKLFQAVCSAVQHAHANLVIHRDLKPTNILVGPDAVPKLLDFGIAKFLSPDLWGETESVTQMAFTPEYASPEQARGGTLTTATDVYSLGVVLYELLTGRKPYRHTSQGPLDLLRAVVEEDPEKPSTAVDRTQAVTGEATPASTDASRTREGTPAKLRRTLLGDLDTIVLMALRKEPARRYPSVAALSEDISRYLDGKPVLARRGTLAYRASKFLRRNALTLSAGSLAFLLLGAFGVAMALESARTRRALEKEEKERATAEKVSSFLVDLFSVSDPDEARGKTVTAREILDRGSSKIEVELKDQPEVRATLMDTMGTVYESLGLYDRAAALSEDALDTRRRVLGEHPDVAKSLNNLAGIREGQGDYPRAEALYREALALRRKLLGNDRPEVAKSLCDLAIVLEDKGEYAEAESLFREALALRRKVLGPDDPEVAVVLNGLANLLYEKGDYAGSETLHRQSLALMRKAYGNDHPNVAASLNNLGNVLADKGDNAAAEGFYRESLAIRRKLEGNDHPEVAATLGNLAAVLSARGDYAGAEALDREALGIRRRLLGHEPDDVAATELLNNLADVLENEGNLPEAEALFRDALRLRRQLLGPEHPRIAESLNGLASVLKDKGDYAGGEPLFHEALAMRRRLLGDDHPTVAESLVGLGDLLNDAGRAGEAEALLREGVAAYRKRAPPDLPALAEAESILGECETRLHRYDEAEPLLLEAYSTLVAQRGEAHRASRAALGRVVRLYEASHRPEKAAEYKARLRPVTARRGTP